MSISTSIFDSKIFNGNFQGNLQAMIDNSLPSLYSNSLWRNYLRWGPRQTSLTFDTIIGRKRLEAAASIVDIDSPAPLRSKGRMESLTGKIPTMKEKFRMDQSDYRAIRLLQEKVMPDNTMKGELLQMLFDNVQPAVTSTDKRLDIMFLQGISTFKIDISTITNPDGPVFGEVDLLADASQTRVVSALWSNAASDPLTDIDTVVNYAANIGRSFKEIWIDRQTWLMIKNYDKVKSAISGYQNPGSNKNFIVTLDIVNEFLVANGLPPLKIINERRGIEKDGVITTINPFRKENVVFIPDGVLGTVQNAWSIEDEEPVEGITYAKYDRTLLKKYRSSDPWTEWTEVELNAFPTLEAIDGIYLLRTDATS